MYTIAKRFTFSASHIIGGLPADHRCARLHGHNYSMALSAHDSKQPVSITGDLIRKGQRWWLEHPRNLIVSSDDALDDSE
jgi:hypothetical protein